MVTKLPDVFSTHSAAKLCRVTPMTIIRWVDEGRIRAYKTPGGHRRIMRADLEAFCREAQIPLEWPSEGEHETTTRVLVVDDDPAVVDAILDALLDGPEAESSGAYAVEHTDNLFEAGLRCALLRPHVVFLDAGMPGADTAQVAAALRALPQFQHTRLVGIVDDPRTPVPGVEDTLARPIARRAVRRITGPLPDLGHLRRRR